MRKKAEVETLGEVAGSDRLLTTEEAAGRLAVSPATLHWWRWRHTGPEFVRMNGARGAVRYSLKALRKFLKERTVKREGPRRSAPQYQKTRIELLGAKHRGLLRYVERNMRWHTPYPEISAELLRRWYEKVSGSTLHNHWANRVWPKIQSEQKIGPVKVRRKESGLRRPAARDAAFQ
jgi:Helix-turn-helix domain